MPSKDGDTVWGQVVKSNERFWRDTGSAMLDFAEKPFDSGPPLEPLKGGYTIPWIGDWLTRLERESYEKQLKEYRADQLKRNEIAGRKAFRDDINRINDQTFDPIVALKKDGWWSGMLEQPAYGAPGTLGTIGMSLLPGGWAPLAIKTQADTHRELRHFLKDHGVDEGRANEMAGEFSLVLTVPMVALDRLQAAGMGKLPFFEAAMKKSAERIGNGALRAATGTALRVGQMQAGNMLQEPLPDLAKEAMHALEKDVPGADWENFFSGYWTRQASTMAVMLPLAAAAGAAHGVGRHLNEKAQVKHLMSRSDTELAALGIRPEHVRAFRAAGDDVPRASEAFREGMRKLDPQGETARAAVQELERQVAAQQEMARSPEATPPQANAPRAPQQAPVPDAAMTQGTPQQEVPGGVPEGPMRKAEPQGDAGTVRPIEDAGAQGGGRIPPRPDSPAKKEGPLALEETTQAPWRAAEDAAVAEGDEVPRRSGVQAPRQDGSSATEAPVTGEAVPSPSRAAEAPRDLKPAAEAPPASITRSVVDAGRINVTDPAPVMRPPRDAAPLDGRGPVTPAELGAATTAPDVRQRFGDVREGSLHALEAYRFLSAKQQKTGRLSPEEQVKFERAKQALAELIGREREMRRSTLGSNGGNVPPERRGIAGNPPAAIEPPSSHRGPARGESIDDPEEDSYLSERHGKRLKKALGLPQDASRQEKEEATRLILDEINRKSRYRNPRAMRGGPLMRGIERPELFHAELTLTPEERLIVSAPHEIVAVFGPDGRIKKAVSDFDPQQSRIPELDGPGHVVTHQHPSGLPPSYMDLEWLIGYNPTQIFRTVAMQQDGSSHLFEMRVIESMDAGEIAAAKLAYKQYVHFNQDTFETRIAAIHAAIRRSNGKIQFKDRRIP